MEDKKIRIGVDAKEVESTFERIKKIAQETAAAMIADAEKRTGSSREMIKALEDEIKLMEREQHMATVERRMTVEDRLKNAPYGERSSLQRELVDIKIDDKEAKLHTELLRDIVDAILGTAKKEVEEDRKSTQEVLAKTPRDQRTFKQRYQAGLMGEDGGLTEEQRRGGMFATGLRGFGAAVIGARSPVEAGFDIAQQGGGIMAGMGGGVAIAGIAIALGAMLGKKTWDTANEFWKAQYRAEAVGGTRMGINEVNDYNKYGVSALDAMQRAVPLMRARRSQSGLKQAIEGQILLERGIGLDQGAFNQVEQLAYLQGETGLGSVQRGIGAMRAGGIVKGQDFSAVPDYLAIMVQLGKEQVARLGKVDMGINMKMVGALAGMDETLKKSPEALNAMVQAVRGGLTAARSPQVEALQYAVLSKIRPGASMFDYMEMRQDPFSKENVRYLPEFLKQLRTLSNGNDDAFYMNIMHQFDLQPQMARKLGSGYTSGRLDKVLKLPEDQLEEGVADLMGRAKRTTTEKELASAWTDTKVAEIGDGVKDAVLWLEKIFNKLPFVPGPMGVPMVNPTFKFHQ